MVDPNGRCKENGINKSKRETFQLSQVKKNFVINVSFSDKKRSVVPAFHCWISDFCVLSPYLDYTLMTLLKNKNIHSFYLRKSLKIAQKIQSDLYALCLRYHTINMSPREGDTKMWSKKYRTLKSRCRNKLLKWNLLFSFLVRLSLIQFLRKGYVGLFTPPRACLAHLWPV